MLMDVSEQRRHVERQIGDAVSDAKVSAVDDIRRVGLHSVLCTELVERVQRVVLSALYLYR